MLLRFTRFKICVFTNIYEKTTINSNFYLELILKYYENLKSIDNELYEGHMEPPLRIILVTELTTIELFVKPLKEG